MRATDIDARFRTLEFRYRGVSSAASVAKAVYLALTREPGAAPIAIERAKSHWQILNTLRRTIAAQMGALERLEPDTSL